MRRKRNALTLRCASMQLHWTIVIENEICAHCKIKPIRMCIVCAFNCLSISHHWAFWRRFSAGESRNAPTSAIDFVCWTFNCTLIFVEFWCVRDSLSVCSQADSFSEWFKNAKLEKFEKSCAVQNSCKFNSLNSVCFFEISVCFWTQKRNRTKNPSIVCN